MKNGFLIAALVFITAAFTYKPEVAKFKVFGNCGECKERIELALDQPGIRSAEWNIDSKIVEVVYVAEKITLKQIHELIAKAGHDTELAKAPDSVYAKLPDCCLYREKPNTHHD